MSFLGISATTDSSNTSTDRDLSTEIHLNVYKNNGVIDSPQISYETVIPGRNIDNEATGNTVRNSVTTKEALAQQESDSKVDEVDANDDNSNAAQMEEDPTVTPSTRTVVTNETTLILDHQINQYNVTTNIHSQDHSGSQSVSETVPMEAQDSGHQEVPGQATATFKTTFSDPPIESSLVTGKSTIPSIAASSG